MISDYNQFRSFFASQDVPEKAFDVSRDDETTNLHTVSMESITALSRWTENSYDRKNRKLQIIPGYIESMIPNAVADSDGSNFYIGINNALFVIIHEFSMFCFAQQNFFPNIGDANNEVSPEPLDGRAPGLWLLNHTTKGERVSDLHSKHLIPRCSERYVASIYLAQIMLRYVWLHELAHCCNGHIGFIRDNKIASRVHELETGLSAAQLSNNKITRNLEQMQLLEFDADSVAFAGSVRIQNHGLENVEGIRNLGKDQAIDLTIFGAFAMAWLFEEIQAYLNVRKNVSHPAPYLRLHNLVRTANKYLESELADIRDRSQSAYEKFDSIKGVIPKIYSGQKIAADLESDAFQLQFLKIDREMTTLRDKLQIYRFDPKPIET